MIYPRFAYIPQPVFSDQRDTERVFVVARRHVIDFLQSLMVLISLIILPVIFVFLFGEAIAGYIQSSPVFAADIILLGSMFYLLMLLMVFMTSWVGFYYNLLVVTDERIVEITQKGFFSRETFELTYDQIEDVDYVSKGLLATYFDVGNIEVQTAGPQRNFFIKMIPKPQVIGAIIHDMEVQSKDKIPVANRMPRGEIIGLISDVPVVGTAKIPPIMNFRGGLDQSRRKFVQQKIQPKSFRQKFDLWWWTLLKREQVIFLDYQSHEFLDKAGEPEGERSGKELVDL